MPRQKPTITFGPDVSDPVFEDWADEIENRDRSNDRVPSNLIPGRKSLSGNGKHSPVVQFRVSETTRAALEEIAAARNVTVSKLSRQVLDEFIESQRG